MDTGLALRSEVFEPSLIWKIAPKLDEQSFASVWFPDVAGFDSLELVALTLGATSRITAATGVLRFHEHDPAHMARRVITLNSASSGRLILGVGTGAMHGGEAVKGVRSWVESLRKLAGAETKVFVAALRKSMFTAASLYADGALLNFCSPQHVLHLRENLRQARKGFLTACYIKLFYSRKEFAARRMFFDEFLKYDSYPHYHKLFEELGAAESIQRIKSSENPSRDLEEPLLSIARYNPDKEEVRELVDEFRRSGVELPIVYPYVEGDADYKLEVIKELSQIFG
jgi:Coenzyme F420-dependent N5,N10-methylene tetrahydromethanopterin reductase and related flavin-dependent oxidoreductases